MQSALPPCTLVAHDRFPKSDKRKAQKHHFEACEAPKAAATAGSRSHAPDLERRSRSSPEDYTEWLVERSYLQLNRVWRRKVQAAFQTESAPAAADVAPCLKIQKPATLGHRCRKPAKRSHLRQSCRSGCGRSSICPSRSIGRRSVGDFSSSAGAQTGDSASRRSRTESGLPG
jgi:hypothetical protein